MRAKDLKVYILILIFFLVCLIGITGVYQFGVNSLLDDNATNQSQSYYNASLSDMDAGIEHYYAEFLNGSETVASATVSKTDLFCNSKYAFSTQANAEGSGSGTYFVYYKVDDRYGRISLSDVMGYALDGDKENVVMIIDSNGAIYASNVLYQTSSALEIFTRTNSSSKANAIVDAAKGLEEYNDKANLIVGTSEDSKKASGYVVVGEYNGLGFVRFVNNSIIAEPSKITSLKVGYFAGMILIVIGTIVTIALMIRKTVKSSGVETGFSGKGTNIIIVCKANGKISRYNKAFRIAFPGHKVPVQSIAELSVCDTDMDVQSLIKNQKKFIVAYKGVEDENGNKDHEDIYFEFYALKRTSDYSLVGKECTSDYLNEQILIKTSTKSSVTGDDNGVVLARRYGEVKTKYQSVNDPYTLIMVNLRGFKDINTLLGFEQGNDVLSFFANMLHETFKELELFHIQADEFVLLDEKGNEAADLQIIDHLLDSLKAPIQINTNEIMLRPAFGIVGSDMDGQTEIDYEAVISKLIIATDKAKASAGKTVCKYDVNLENSALKDRQMEDDLKNAISRGEFVMFYQPQYEINQERVCGFEALLRWNNPKYASISPEVYIKMAEKNGYIIDVGNFINADVFKTAKEMEPYDIHISVNVSPAQIVQAGFVADFLEKFEKNGLKPGTIALEVTETFLMENFNAVIEKLQILKNRGISIHLDDFGTGYSSMLYLKELPIDTIKVDKEFIKHIETDRFSKVLTSKIITLAKELGDKVICEGVETKVQKDIVGKFGADIIQGYYIGKALSKEDAFALLKTGKVSSENKSNGKQGDD